MMDKQSKNATVLAIISLSLLAGSFLILPLLDVIGNCFGEVASEWMIVVFLMMQVASLVLSIIAMKYKTNAIAIISLVFSIVVIVLEIVFVALLIWTIGMACSALAGEVNNPGSEFWQIIQGCGEIG